MYRSILASCSALFIFATPARSTGPEHGPPPLSEANAEVVLATLNTAVRTLLEKQKDFSFTAPQVQPEGDGFLVTGTASVFGIGSVNIESRLANATTVTSLKATFPANTDLDRGDQKKLTSTVMDRWVPASLKDILKMNTFTLAFVDNSVTHVDISMTCALWPLLGSTPLGMRGLEVIYAVENPIDRRSSSMRGTFTGVVEVGGGSMTLSATAADDKEEWVMTNTLERVSLDALLSAVGQSRPENVPNALWDFGLENCTFTFAPFSSALTMNASTSIGTAEFALRPSDKRGSSHQFLLGYSPPADLSFSRLDPGLVVLDQLQLRRTALVLSSGDQRSGLALFSSLGEDPTVGRGLTLLSAYDVSALSPELANLMGQSTLLLRAQLSNNVSGLKLQAGLRTNINLAANGSVVLKGVNFTIEPAPSNFTVSLGGEMDVQVNKDVLTFKTNIGVDITNLALQAEGMLKGEWNNPFGISQGVQVSNLGLGFGVSFKTTPIPLPALSFAGTLKVGDPGNPRFSGDVAVAVDLSNPTNGMVDAGFNKIKLDDIVQACAPTANVPANLRNTVLSAELQDARLTIVPSPVGFTLFEKSYEPGFLVAGKASLANFSAQLLVSVAKDGVEARAGIGAIRYEPYFALTGAQADADPSIHLVLRKPEDSGLSITGKVSLLGIEREAKVTISDTDFNLHTEGKLFNVFDGSIDLGGSSLQDGGSFHVKVEMRNDLFAFVTEQASLAIDAATKQTQNDITAAQQTVTREQEKMNGLYSEVDAMKRTVQAERDRDHERLRSAESSVASAQNEVNSLQNQINDLHGRINRLNSQISSEPWRAIDLGAEVTAYYVSIGALEASKGIAWGVLEGAKQTVGGMAYLSQAIPVDADPRVAGLIASIETSKGVMEGAKQVMEGAKVVGVGSLSAANWIVQHGNPMGVVNVTYAMFEGDLSASHGGSVRMKVRGTFADQPLDTEFGFAFGSPKETVETWARSLVGM